MLHLSPWCTSRKNKANIYIKKSVRKLPTIQKAVAIASLKSGSANYVHKCHHIFVGGCYAAPHLLALIMTNFNICTFGTYNANIIGFDSGKLPFGKGVERDPFKRLVYKRLRIIII